MKRCSKCERDLPREMFHRSRSRWDGLACYCKPCFREVRAKYLRRPSAQCAHRANVRRWERLHPERRAIWSAKYRGSARVKALQLTIDRANHALLTDGAVRKMLISQTDGILRAAAIPHALINVKRQHILLLRQLRSNP